MCYVVPSVPGRDFNEPNNGEEVARGVFCTLGLIPYHRIVGGNRTRACTRGLDSVVRNFERDVTIGVGDITIGVGDITIGVGDV